MKARLLPSDSCFCRSRQKTVVLALKNADWLRRKTLPPCSVIKVDKIARVTVNSRSTMTGSVVSTQSNAGKGRVFVTPLSQGIAHSPLVIPQQRSGGVHPQAVLSQLQPPQNGTPVYISLCSQQQEEACKPFEKVYLKAVTKETKKDEKTFAIHDVDPARILSCLDFKRVIRVQLNKEITHDDYDIGFIRGTSAIRVCNEQELWSDLWKQNNFEV